MAGVRRGADRGLRRFAKATRRVAHGVRARHGRRTRGTPQRRRDRPPRAVLCAVPKEKLPNLQRLLRAAHVLRGIPFSERSLWAAVVLGDVLSASTGGPRGRGLRGSLVPRWPMRRRVYSGAEIIANVSASPYRVGVVATRREMIATRSGDNQCAIAYANAVGGRTAWSRRRRLGLSERPHAARGAPLPRGVGADHHRSRRTTRLRAENTTWRADALAYAAAASGCAPSPAITPADRSQLKYPRPPTRASPAVDDPASRRAHRVLRGSARRPGPRGRRLLREEPLQADRDRALGGRDSRSPCSLAWALRRRARQELIRCFYMPSRYSSSQTSKAAEQICADRGVPFAVVSIEDAFQRELEATEKMLGPGEKITPVTLQNIQARVRGARMWNWSNSTGGLFLQTGNMSEKSVGYTTIGGDLEGALSVISNVPKTVASTCSSYLATSTVPRDRRGLRAARGTRARRCTGRGEGSHAVPDPRRLPRALLRREARPGEIGWRSRAVSPTCRERSPPHAHAS